MILSRNQIDGNLEDNIPDREKDKHKGPRADRGLIHVGKEEKCLMARAMCTRGSHHGLSEAGGGRPLWILLKGNGRKGDPSPYRGFL